MTETQMKLMPEVELSRVPSFYHNYIKLVQDKDLKDIFRKHQLDMVLFLQSIPEEKWNYRYAEGKWSIRELVQHLIDAERIFCYRALRFARKDQTELPGFEENDYAISSKADRRSSKDLIEELKTVQQSSAQLFNSFDEEMLEQSGISNGKSIYVRAIGFIIAGHVLHHKKVMEERYL